MDRTPGPSFAISDTFIIAIHRVVVDRLVAALESCCSSRFAYLGLAFAFTFAADIAFVKTAPQSFASCLGLTFAFACHLTSCRLAFAAAPSFVVRPLITAGLGLESFTFASILERRPLVENHLEFLRHS